MDEAFLHETVTRIISIFLSLPEAGPDDDLARQYAVTPDVELDFLQKLLLQRGTPSQMWCYGKFGAGHVELQFNWTSDTPELKITVVSKYGHVSGLPHDQPHRTWQRLSAACRKAGIADGIFNMLVSFSNVSKVTISRKDFEFIEIAMMPDGPTKEFRIAEYLQFVPLDMMANVEYGLRHLKHHMESSGKQS